MSSFSSHDYFSNIAATNNGYTGFTPPTGVPQLLIGKDNFGRPVIISDGSVPYDPNASYEADLSMLRSMIANHDWYYKYRNDHGIYMSGFRNEQEIENLIRRRGGVFETIWNTEKTRHGGGMMI